MVVVWLIVKSFFILGSLSVSLRNPDLVVVHIPWRLKVIPFANETFESLWVKEEWWIL